jgi:hypothetical protein
MIILRNACCVRLGLYSVASVQTSEIYKHMIPLSAYYVQHCMSGLIVR